MRATDDNRQNNAMSNCGAGVVGCHGAGVGCHGASRGKSCWRFVVGLSSHSFSLSCRTLQPELKGNQEAQIIKETVKTSDQGIEI